MSRAGSEFGEHPRDRERGSGGQAAGIRDRGDTLTNYQIQPGDRVIVPGAKPPGLLGSLLGQ